MPNKAIGIIDLKAFYASVECVERGLDPFTTPLVVCDTSRGMGTIILSVTPYLKERGVPSRLRRRELPYFEGMIFAKPQMQKYIEESCKFIEIILKYVSEEDIHIYSIDECFINLGPYLSYYNKTPYELIKMIKDDIKSTLGYTTSAGISYNIFMSKVALDIDAKHHAPDFIAEWHENDVKDKLWKIENMKDIWGISTGYINRLKKLGIDTINDLAHANPDYLKQNLGIMGEQLYQLANGIDESDIREKYIPMSTSLSIGQSLYKDYNYIETKQLLREISDELCIRLHKAKKSVKRLSLAIIYSYNTGIPGYVKQMTLDFPTDINDDIYKAILEIYESNTRLDVPIRKVYLSFSKLCDGNVIYQTLLNYDQENEHKRNFNLVVEEIKSKYGMQSLSRASAKLEKSVYDTRIHQIGGHNK